MPRQLALVLCTAFVVFLLRQERRQSAGVSAAMWIPTLWMLAIASKPLGIWFGMAGQAESGSWPDRLLLMGLSAAGFAVLARRRHDWLRALSRSGWLIALLAYMLLSTLWSDIPAIAVRRWVREAIILVVALVIMSEANPRQALESLLRRSTYILLPFSLMLIKYYPALGVEYARWSGLQMWVGVTLHKNTLGRLCLISAIFLLWALYRHWRARTPAVGRYEIWADVSVLLIALFLLSGDEGAYSATSLGTFVFGTATLIGLSWLRGLHIRVPRTGLAALVIILIGFGAAAPFLGGSNLASVSSTFGRDETLTGRTQTWAELVPVVERQPLLGSGFGSFWTTARRDFYQMSHGHNGYLDILLEIGAVGLAIYIAWLVSCALRLHGALGKDYAWASLALCFLLMALVYNSTESALNSLTEQMTAVVVLVSMVVPHESIRFPGRSHLRVRLHLPAERVAGTAPAPPEGSANRRAVRVLDRRGGQRRWRTRTGGSGEGPGRTSP
jgi:O-antigen ligase